MKLQLIVPVVSRGFDLYSEKTEKTGFDALKYHGRAILEYSIRVQVQKPQWQNRQIMKLVLRMHKWNHAVCQNVLRSVRTGSFGIYVYISVCLRVAS